MKPAAQYLRMSTDHQTYSLAFQAAHNTAFAAENGLQIVRTYTDAGVSGLTFERRPGLRELMADVVGGGAPFGAILVYDVSRWGRFQDPDQAAHYEFMCREAGVEVLYTAEPFAADGSLSAAIVKQLKRAMAAEYSRELSAKVRDAQRGLQALGYWQGGPPGFGLRRLAVSPAGAPLAKMESGEQKALRGARTVLVPGPSHEVEIVRRIFREFLEGERRVVDIAHGLNTEGVTSEGAAPWTTHRVRRVLRDEKYAGVMVGRKADYTFGRRRNRRREAWARIPDALQPLIGRAEFDAVQARFRRPKPPHVPDDLLLDALRRVLADHGRLSADLIDRHPATHCADIYRRRFGGLLGAYRRLGLQPNGRQLAAAARAGRHQPWTFRTTAAAIDPEAGWRKLEAHYAARGRVSCQTIADDPALPSVEWYRRHFGRMELIYQRLDYAPDAAQRRRLRSAASARQAGRHAAGQQDHDQQGGGQHAPP